MSGQPTSGSRVHLGRRSVIRAGAWAAPAVAVGVATPAFAASGPGRLSFNTAGVDVLDDGEGNKNGLRTRVQVQNDYVTGGPTLNSVTLLVTYPTDRVSGEAPTNLTGSGWSFTAPATNAGGLWTYEFTHTGAIPGGSNTGQLTYDLPLNNTARGSFQVTFKATASGLTTPPTSTSVQI